MKNKIHLLTIPVLIVISAGAIVYVANNLVVHPVAQIIAIAYFITRVINAIANLIKAIKFPNQSKKTKSNDTS